MCFRKLNWTCLIISAISTSFTRMIRLASAILLVIAAGILQNTDLLNIAGVKPNLSLAALIVLGFFINKFTDYLILILISALLIKTAAGFEISIIVFAAIPAIFYFARRRYFYFRGGV